MLLFTLLLSCAKSFHQEENCRADPAPWNRDRVILVSRPFDEAGEEVDTWSVLTLDRLGGIYDDGLTVDLGHTESGRAVFTPDGKIALAVHDAGRVAMYDVASGSVITDDAAPLAYASQVVMDPSGNHAWVLDENWVENGGGIYKITIDCETGEALNSGKFVETKLAQHLAIWGQMAIVVAEEVEANPGQVHLVDLLESDWVDAVDVFDAADPAVSDLVVSDEGGFAVVGSDSRQVATIALGDTLDVTGLVQLDGDPTGLAVSPYGEVILAGSDEGDAIYSIAPGAQGPEVLGTVSEAFAPTFTDVVPRGELGGLTFVIDDDAIHRIRMSEGGEVKSMGRVLIYGDDPTPLGAIGVQP